MSLVFLDTETTGLERHHDIWEIAYAFDDEFIFSSHVPHSIVNSQPEALEVSRYYDRGGPLVTVEMGVHFEADLIQRLLTERPTLVGANPAFDAERLLRRWGWSHEAAPWHYRLLDVENYAASVLGWETPRGLNSTADALRERGFDVPEPDHTAAGDVDTVRQVYRATRGLVALQRAAMSEEGA